MGCLLSCYLVLGTLIGLGLGILLRCGFVVWTKVFVLVGWVCGGFLVVGLLCVAGFLILGGGYCG